MKLYLIAGEPSGDRLGAALMAGLKTLVPQVAFHGIGGPLMQAEGLRSQFPMEELSVMGLLEVVPVVSSRSSANLGVTEVSDLSSCKALE